MCLRRMMEASDVKSIPAVILGTWSQSAFRSALFLMLQIDSAGVAIACMGSTKKQVHTHLIDAWLSIHPDQQKERLAPLLAHQTNPDKLITLAAEKGLPQEQLPAMQGTRTDGRLDATRGARTLLNAQASNAGGRELRRITTDEELDHVQKRLRVAQTERDAAQLTYETRILELQGTPLPPEQLLPPGSPGSKSQSSISSASPSATSLQAPLLESQDTHRDELLSELAVPLLSRVRDLAQPNELGISIDTQI